MNSFFLTVGQLVFYVTSDKIFLGTMLAQKRQNTVSWNKELERRAAWQRKFQKRRRRLRRNRKSRKKASCQTALVAIKA